MRSSFALTSMWTVTLMVVVSACSGSDTATSTASGSPRVQQTAPGAPGTADTASRKTRKPPAVDIVEQLIQEALRSDGSISYRDLVRRLGPPQRVTTESIANAYQPGQIDTLRTVTYQGIEALLYDVTAEDKSFLVRFSILNARYATPEGIRVGDTRRSVLDRLGPPTDEGRNPGEMIYQESDATPSAMIVTVREGRVSQIDWEFYFS